MGVIFLSMAGIDSVTLPVASQPDGGPWVHKTVQRFEDNKPVEEQSSA